MKRILAFICVMACLCGLCLPAMAAPDVITVTAQVPEDWTNIHVYAWVDGENCLAAWPGTPMNKADDGRYTLEIPSGYPYVIINDGGAGNQTVDTSVDGVSDTWLIVTGNGNAASCDVEYVDPGIVEGGATTPSTPEAPAALNSMALVGEGVDDLKWEPENSACDMTKAEDGVYTKDLTLYKGTPIKFKLCGNDSWDGGYNLGGNADGIVVTAGTAVELISGNDSKDLTYTATQDCTLTVTLDMNGAAPTVTLTETAAELAPPPEVVYVKVYVSIPEGITPNMWAWGDNGNAFPSWPGQAMTKSGDWWVVEIPNDCHSAIVNDGTSQTADLSINAGADNWIVVGADWTAQVHASEPSLEPAPTPSTPEATQPTTGAKDEVKTEDKTEDKKDEGGLNIFVIITIILAVGAVAAVVVTLIIINKKK